LHKGFPAEHKGIPAGFFLKFIFQRIRAQNTQKWVRNFPKNSCRESLIRQRIRAQNFDTFFAPFYKGFRQDIRDYGQEKFFRGSKPRSKILTIFQNNIFLNFFQKLAFFCKGFPAGISCRDSLINFYRDSLIKNSVFLKFLPGIPYENLPGIPCKIPAGNPLQSSIFSCRESLRPNFSIIFL